MHLSALETPCLMLDKPALMRNIAHLGKRLRDLGVSLRPHGKTAKSIDVMRLVLADQSGGITVSTLAEADYYFEHGVVDIVYAVGIAPAKLDRVGRLIRNGARLTVVLDSVTQAGAVAAAARKAGIVIPALIEVDCDGHRSGVTPNDPALLEIGRLLDGESGATLAGVLTHAGESYQCRSPDGIRDAARQERDTAVECAETLRRNDLPCPIVSVGSTPTATFADDLTGVTEVRAGVYMFQDLMMAGLGVCTVNDIAISVLTSVIGHQKQKGWVMTDAGWTALSRDRGTATQVTDQGYGLVCDVSGKPLADVIVSSTSQEHGIVSARNGAQLDFTQFAVGTMLRILPNHACATGAMHSRYHVTDGSTEVVDTWDRINGW